MLRKTDDAPAPLLNKWLDRLAPVAAEARTALAQVKPTKLAMRSGCTIDAEGALHLEFFWAEYAVSAGNFAVQRVATGAEPSSFTQSLILTYLAQADGTTPSGRWVSFRELPSGIFYSQAFQSYSGDRLARELPLDPQTAVSGLERAATRLRGRPLDIGDVGYAFTVLPRLHVGIAYWAGDDEFLPRARVLFEDTSAHYMPTDGLAILGSQLVSQVLKVAKADTS